MSTAHPSLRLRLDITPTKTYADTSDVEHEAPLDEWIQHGAFGAVASIRLISARRATPKQRRQYAEDAHA